jgi:DNA-binding XRE family transcriptional regulator
LGPRALKKPSSGADPAGDARAIPRAFCAESKAEVALVAENNVRRIREELMMSKAELARKAGLSTLTIDRVEAGRPCRLDTKRKILLALGFKVSDKDRVFGVRALEAGQDPGSRPEAA